MADTKYAVKSGFYDSVNHDRLYSADDMNQPYKSMLSAGIIEGGFAVTPQSTPDMTVNVAAGHALLGDKWVDAAAKTLTVPENTALYGRIDAIVLRVDINTDVRAADLIYRTGTPASEPEAPALIGTTGIYEVRLANITVAAGATAIAAAQISDQRGTSGCPYVMMTVGNAQIQAAVEDVLEAHPEWTTTVEDGSITLQKLAAGVIDNTLTQAGAAADAKTTGDALTALNNDLSDVKDALSDYEASIMQIANFKSASSGSKIFEYAIENGSTFEVSATANIGDVDLGTYDPSMGFTVIQHAIDYVNIGESKTFVANAIGATHIRIYFASAGVTTLKNLTNGVLNDIQEQLDGVGDKLDYYTYRNVNISASGSAARVFDLRKGYRYRFYNDSSITTAVEVSYYSSGTSYVYVSDNLTAKSSVLFTPSDDVKRLRTYGNGSYICRRFIFDGYK